MENIVLLILLGSFNYLLTWRLLSQWVFIRMIEHSRFNLKLYIIVEHLRLFNDNLRNSSFHVNAHFVPTNSIVFQQPPGYDSVYYSMRKRKEWILRYTEYFFLAISERMLNRFEKLNGNGEQFCKKFYIGF